MAIFTKYGNKIIPNAQWESNFFNGYFSPIVVEIKILQQDEIVAIFMSIYFAQSILSFGQYEMKSSKARPFRGSIIMQFRWSEPSQFLPHVSQFAFKSVEK